MIASARSLASGFLVALFLMALPALALGSAAGAAPRSAESLLPAPPGSAPAVAGQVLGRAAARQAASGSFVVADTWRSRPDVRPAEAWAQATGIDIAADGRVFVVDGDPYQPRLTLREADGRWRDLAPVAAHLARPGHLAVDAARDRLYVADLGRQSLEVFDLEGRHLRSQAGIPGAYGVAAGPDGTVYVSAAASGEIHRFAADGTALPVWSVVDPVDGGGLLAGLDVDTAGLVHVLNGRAPEVLRLDRYGQVNSVEEVPATGKLVDLAAMGAPGAGRRVYWFASSTGLSFMIPGEPVDPALPAPGVPVGPLSALAARRDEMVLATSSGFSRGLSLLARFDYAATLAGAQDCAWSGGLLHGLGVLAGPERIELGADGHAYLLDRTGRVQRFALDGSPLRQMRLGDPIAVGAGPAGEVFALDGDRLGARAFEAPDVDGRALWQSPVAAGAGDDPFATGLAVDASAPGGPQLVVLDVVGRTLRRWSAAGQPLGAPVTLTTRPGEPEAWSDLALDGAGRAYALNRTMQQLRIAERDGAMRSLPLKAPAKRIAVAPDGTVFALARDGLVWHYDAAGEILDVFDARRLDIHADSRPSDLVVDARGEVYVTDRNADIVSHFRWDPEAPAMLPPPTDPTCQSLPDKAVDPTRLPLGATVNVSLSLSGACGAAMVAPPMDVFLILDRSGSMLQDRRMEIARQAALDFVQEIDLLESRIGLVSFNHEAGLDMGLTADEGRLWHALRGLTPFGSTRIDLGLQTARYEWLRSRREGVRTVFIVLSDGASDRASALAEAQLAKDEGVEIFTIGVAADAQLLQDIATDSAHYFGTSDPNFLFRIFEAIAQQLTAVSLFRTIEVVDVLPDHMRYVPGSAQPPGAWFDPGTNTLRWALADVAFSGFRLSYRMIPQVAGTWPVSQATWGDFVDGLGRAGRVDFPIPSVEVLAPSPTPTPLPTATPTPPPAIFLPIALWEVCDPEERFTDAILVIDTSGSMEGEKLAAAQAAARTFAGLMRLAPDAEGRYDQVAVIAFNSQAHLLTPLTRDPRRIEAAIAGLPMANGTYIDRGLGLAWDEMRSPRRRAGNAPAVIVLTDGIQSGDPAPAQALGDTICAAGGNLYTIGLGDDVDLGYLESLACRPEMRYLAPTPDELAAIYTAIAGDIDCPLEQFWGKR